MAGMIRDRFPTIRQGIDTAAGWPSSPFIDAPAQLRDRPPSRTVGRVSYTVLSPDHVVESTLEIKKSVFLTTVTRVETEEQAREFIDQGAAPIALPGTMSARSSWTRCAPPNVPATTASPREPPVCPPWRHS